MDQEGGNAFLNIRIAGNKRPYLDPGSSRAAFRAMPLRVNHLHFPRWKPIRVNPKKTPLTR